VATTTVDNLKEALQKYQAGTMALGELLAILLRFLDLTEEPPEVEPPAPPPAPAPAPAPAVASRTTKGDKS
jgi:hypothetical protein